MGSKQEMYSKLKDKTINLLQLQKMLISKKDTLSFEEYERLLKILEDFSNFDFDSFDTKQKITND